MPLNSLDSFVAQIRSDWGPLTSPLVAKTRQRLAELSLAQPDEEWLRDLQEKRPAAHELHRDVRGFMLLAHAESQGLYRAPHDHGRAWVVYAVQSGRLEVGTYARQTDGSGRESLVRRDTTVLLPGETRAYLAGDIHDTRCIDDALLFRFTERDLRHEDRVERRVTRFVELDGDWVASQS